jgi:hypothetical protein
MRLGQLAEPPPRGRTAAHYPRSSIGFNLPRAGPAEQNGRPGYEARAQPGEQRMTREDAALVTSATGPQCKSQRPGVAWLANIAASPA